MFQAPEPFPEPGIAIPVRSCIVSRFKPMREYSLCAGIVAAVVQEYERIDPPPARLKRVKVVAGSLHQIVPEYLVSAYELLSRETPAEGSEMDLVMAPIVCRCRACGWEGGIDPPFFQCGSCEKLDVDVVGGNELYLESLEVEEDEGRETD